ncbi:NUDIX domain-containing protein [Nitratireductor sp. XY-223]|uniref:NUDIX hydrolase n=1 Tax=Nitratireductor sp. XY-223 TaxID=2561926 RepID=UPI0010AA0F4E|nr:NUDIX domain-containing protein [Nitratireductor sp. XY-223]
MRTRPASRLIVLDPRGRVLLFRFVFERGPLAGRDYWATPGGGLEAGETFRRAALRELREETGIEAGDVGPEIARRQFELQLPDGEIVRADERFFRIAVQQPTVSRSGWTVLETQVMKEHRWWTRGEILKTTDTVYPEDLVALLGGG